MFVDKIGLELEGGWEGKPGKRPFKDEEIIIDRSIDGQTLPNDGPMKSVHVGEIVSKPMSLDKWEEWLRKYWPSEANNTCGYHIHLSMKKPLYYILLTRKKFLFDLLDDIMQKAKELELPEGHYLYQRLSGRNPFCMFNFDPSQQIGVEEKRIGMRTRYGVINYCHGLHKTVEFRALPTFKNPDHAVEFTHVYLDRVRRYLEDVAGRNWKQSISLREEDGVVKVTRAKGDNISCA
jgi:hypothetical protein